MENAISAVTCGETMLGNVTTSNIVPLTIGNATLRNANNGNAMTVRQENAPQDLDLVSWPPSKVWTANMPGYDYDVTMGVDTYIYVIDHGINMFNRVTPSFGLP